jgi:hypothetical protein
MLAGLAPEQLFLALRVLDVDHTAAVPVDRDVIGARMDEELLPDGRPDLRLRRLEHALAPVQHHAGLLVRSSSRSPPRSPASCAGARRAGGQDCAEKCTFYAC